MIRRLALILCLSACATPLRAQELSDFDAMVEVLRGPIAEQFGPAVFKTEAAEIYWKPYLADDTKWEKKARTDWYAAQLPTDFPKKGAVSVLYLERCRPKLPSGDLLDGDGERGKPDVVRAGDVAFIRNALETRGVTGIALGSLKGRDGWPRTDPDTGLRAINADLQQRFAAGSLTGRIAIFEPFCPATQRGSHEQALERYELAMARWEALPAPKPAPPAPPPPPPPPLPPPYPVYAPTPPIKFMRPASTSIFLISEFRSRICRQKTGSYYASSCQGWTAMLGDEMVLSGRHYRYRIEPTTGAARVGAIDLYMQPNPIDLTQ